MRAVLPLRVRRAIFVNADCLRAQGLVACRRAAIIPHKIARSRSRYASPIPPRHVRPPSCLPNVHRLPVGSVYALVAHLRPLSRRFMRRTLECRASRCRLGLGRTARHTARWRARERTTERAAPTHCPGTVHCAVPRWSSTPRCPVGRCSARRRPRPAPPCSPVHPSAWIVRAVVLPPGGTREGARARARTTHKPRRGRAAARCGAARARTRTPRLRCDGRKRDARDDGHEK